MPRKISQINIEDKQSLEALLQEAYIDACKLENETQKTVNRIKRAPSPDTMDDYAKQAKEITAALKLKEAAVKLKLEVAKVQHDFIKKNGVVEEVTKTQDTGKVDFNDFEQIRSLVQSQTNKKDDK